MEVKPNLNETVFICGTCGSDFKSRKVCKSRTPKFCGKKCYAESLKKPIKPKAERASRKGIPLNVSWRKALSDGRKASVKCKGENLYNWKGGEATKAQRFKEHGKKRYHRRKAGGELPISYLSALRICQRHKCFYCENGLLYDKSTHIEHLQPISKGGNNSWQNLVLSCQRCNNKKKDKTLVEFAINQLRPDWLDKSFIIQINAHDLSKRIKA